MRIATLAKFAYMGSNSRRVWFGGGMDKIPQKKGYSNDYSYVFRVLVRTVFFLGTGFQTNVYVGAYYD